MFSREHCSRGAATVIAWSHRTGTAQRGSVPPLPKPSPVPTSLFRRLRELKAAVVGGRTGKEKTPIVIVIPVLLSSSLAVLAYSTPIIQVDIIVGTSQPPFLSSLCPFPSPFVVSPAPSISFSFLCSDHFSPVALFFLSPLPFLNRLIYRITGLQSLECLVACNRHFLWLTEA
jgi:hypothetical protein